jgi:hypothetical protein
MVTTETPSFELSTKKGNQGFQEYIEYKKYFDTLFLEEYLITGRPVISYYKDPLFIVDNHVYRVHKNVIWHMSHQTWIHDLKNIEKLPDKLKIGESVPMGFVVPQFEGKNKVYSVIANGDDNYNDLVQYDTSLPSLSFNCLTRFATDGKKEMMNRAIAEQCVKRYQVKDYHCGDSIDLTKKEEKVVATWRKTGKNPLTPPGPGYVLLWSSWHKSASFLLYDNAKDVTVLLGIDEGSYFGCQLADNPTTLDQAYISLIPPDLRKRNDWVRQGEWFVVPIEEKKVPSIENCITTFSKLHLPRSSVDSNVHEITCTDESTDAPQGFIDKNGNIFARYFDLDHPEHSTISIRTHWCTFIRNTAVVSYSEEGVD